MQWSSRPWRRYAVELGTAILASLPLLAGAAMGSLEALPQVDFDDRGFGWLDCGSKPSVGSISVPAEAKVIFVNNLGQSATLQIDGEDSGLLGSGEAVEVQFHRGPVLVAMVPECLFSMAGDFKPVKVQVGLAQTGPQTPPPSASPGPTIGPTGPSPTTGGSNASPTPSQSQSGTPSGSPMPGVVDPTDPERANDEVLFPVDPTDGGPPTSGADSATVVRNPDGFTALRTGTRDRGMIGLLAIIATVCVVGAVAGAIRAIITQRASSAEFI